MVDRYLAIYLRDHLAMSHGGIRLCHRVMSANEHNPLGQELREICVEIEEECDVLEQILKRLKVSRSQFKIAGAWLAEKAGRLKLNGEVLRYSPLSRVVEIEFLMGFAQRRSALWETLTDAKLLYPELEGVPAEELARRAQIHRDRLEELHQQAVRVMLKSGQRDEADEDSEQQSSYESPEQPSP